MCISVLRATFNPKTPQNFNRLEGKDEEMAANNSCYNWTRSTEVLGSRFWAVGVQAEGEEGSSASHVPSGNAHPSSNQKRSRSFRLDLQDIRWLMEVDGTGSDLWSRNLQRFQRTGLLLVELKKKKSGFPSTLTKTEEPSAATSGPRPPALLPAPCGCS